ncbi:hypothetical protein BH23GEM9_BH23GEM9_19750 [soil metagenome]
MAVAMAMAVALPLRAQQPTVRMGVAHDAFIAQDHAITLAFSRPLDATVERAAIFFGTTDVTDLFVGTATELRYRTGALPLPAGDRDIVVYLVTESGWHEIARQPMRVAGRFRVESTRLAPSLDMGLKSRLASGSEPAGPRSDRPTYNDFDGQLGLETEVVRLGDARLATRSSFVGTSHRQSRLRFGDRGDDAPPIDLASYIAQTRRGTLELAVGHVAAGNQRHLIDRFNSRGATLAVSPHTRVNASVAAMRGSNVVGWNDLLGFTEPDHRMLNATLGVEALPTAGALRIEVSALDGSLLPRTGFNQAAVTDAEQSRGMAVRVQASGLNRRLRLDGGFTRSSFDNPSDPLLARGEDLVPVQRETRNARYLETSLDVLRGTRLGGRRTARMSIGVTHERVDPLFRSVASFAGADRLQNSLNVRGDIAGIGIGASHARSENNLDRLSSILTALTRRTSIDVGVPVATVVGARPSAWWPSLRSRFDRTHQFGEAVPAAGGFSPSHVPDQLSDNLTFGADWRWSRVTIGYQVGRAFQDNRQPGREDADLLTWSNGINLSLTPVRKLSLGANVSLVTAENLEREETDRTNRYALNATWQPLTAGALALQLSNTSRENDGRGSTHDSRSFSAQWSSPVPGLARFSGKWHVRYSALINAAKDPTLNLATRREDWSLDSGLTFKFF